MQTATILREEEAVGNFLVRKERSVFHLMRVRQLVIDGSLYTFKPEPETCKRWNSESKQWESTPCMAAITYTHPLIVRKKAGYALCALGEEAFLLLGGIEPVSPEDRGELAVADATGGDV